MKSNKFLDDSFSLIADKVDTLQLERVDDCRIRFPIAWTQRRRNPAVRRTGNHSIKLCLLTYFPSPVASLNYFSNASKTFFQTLSILNGFYLRFFAHNDIFD